MTETMPTVLLDQELLKAKTREEVARRKLERLKERYRQLQELTSQPEPESHPAEQRLAEVLQEHLALQERHQRLQDEAAMWKSQLFEQLDRLEIREMEFQALRGELAETQWQLVELLNEERTRSETERAHLEMQLDALQRELTASRARVDGLKNLGACLAAKLERAASERQTSQLAQLEQTQQLAASLAQLEQKDQEIQELRSELFETRRRLLSHQLDQADWVELKRGLEIPVAVAPSSFDSAGDAEACEEAAVVPRRRLRLAAAPQSPEPRILPIRDWWTQASRSLESWMRRRP